MQEEEAVPGIRLEIEQVSKRERAQLVADLRAILVKRGATVEVFDGDLCVRITGPSSVLTWLWFRVWKEAPMREGESRLTQDGVRLSVFGQILETS